MKQVFYIVIFLLAAHCCVHAQAEFVENKGQWPAQVKFRAELPAGALWAEEGGFTFRFYDPEILSYMHPAGGVLQGSPMLRSHAYKVHFINGLMPATSGSKTQTPYYNYYLSPDEAQWADHCRAFARCDYSGIYPGVDLVLYSKSDAVKYDFVIHPGADANDIQLGFEGDVHLSIRQDELHVVTSVNELIEKAPYAYQLIDGKIVEVACQFVLKNNTVSFHTGKYNKQFDLIIDPEIAFSTYIGSTASNFGFTACDDTQGNLISGATVFANGYPTTTGAWNTEMNLTPGNYMDLAISKFNNDGTQLLFSTYIGGGGQETPHSIVADSNDNFIVMGVTGSIDYPTSATAYQQNFIGGPFLNMANFFTSFHAEGTDLFISKFTSAGSLFASTFLGGTDNDGLNYADQLYYNYGDAFRGEINADSDWIYGASVTRSTDFPVAGSAIQGSYGGGDSDGVIFKFNSDLTLLMESTFVGGSGSDACYAIEFSPTGNAVVVGGGTQSADFPLITNSSSFGGETDGFILRLSVGYFFTAGTFLGTPEYDQVYFIQVDAANTVYAYGQTEGDMAITPGHYGVPNSGQFVCNYSQDLETQNWNTTIGTGSGEIDISPTAFLVSDCEQIYLSGWGGQVNQYCGSIYDCYAFNSTTNGLPTTADAYQLTTDGSDFYLCVLTPDATDLLYGSFLGGDQSAEHVDGGTSRFDKNGSVYQAVCAGCGAHSDFPTTPGAWSATNNSTTGTGNCNIAVFRFDLNAVQAHVEIDGPSQVCAGTTVSFINESIGASSFQWSFGDGEMSEEFQPSHIYEDSGTFVISLIGLDDALCVNSDTVQVVITILPGVDPEIEMVPLMCLGETVQLDGTGSENLHWLPNAALSALNIPDPIASPTVTTTFYLVDSNDCETDTASVVVAVSIPNTTINEDVTICIGESAPLAATGGTSYSWSPATWLSNPSIADPITTAQSTTTYTVTITTIDDCVVEEEVEVNVVLDSPGGLTYPDINLCEGSLAHLHAEDGSSWSWSPATALSSTTIQEPYANPSDTTHYAVVITNACGEGTDFITINVVKPHLEAWGGGTICSGSSVAAFASGATEYLWQPAVYATPHNADTTMLAPTSSTWFVVTSMDENNCADIDSVYVMVLPDAYVNAGPDQYFNYPGYVYLYGDASGLDYYWWPSNDLSCTDCLQPMATPAETIFYHLTVTDHNGCSTTDSVLVHPYFPLWVPNCITPNNDGINDYFRAYGEHISGFHLRIFDRWGLKVFDSEDIEEVWTGGVSGGEYYVQNDVYSWVIEYDTVERREKLVGHVTVAR